MQTFTKFTPEELLTIQRLVRKSRVKLRKSVLEKLERATDFATHYRSDLELIGPDDEDVEDDEEDEPMGEEEYQDLRRFVTGSGRSSYFEGVDDSI